MGKIPKKSVFFCPKPGDDEEEGGYMAVRVCFLLLKKDSGEDGGDEKLRGDILPYHSTHEDKICHDFSS